ncbi:hypothetical protein CYLTODRAFT_419710 [Cylindrobasidium torrendii FP15055 ss-10]|uniref:Zn(2)-C6 fungal-type domain-containing protein n=1 Tax=Cylindrobasidium torrendii FP15055 ss-10 TaxID=1314674 RepID=A0A0D7BJQ6_9AGAR|nr:hypothetical protein CYLTODRAFT_419710 [Cylindrobasidium torrendii FP15055 ss-10]
MARDQENASISATKKRRVARAACDTCKRRKVKCDSEDMPGRRCTNCAKANLPCTQLDPQLMGPAQGHIRRLEKRIELLELLFSKLLPSVNLERELEALDLSQGSPSSSSDTPAGRSNYDESVADLSDSINTLYVQDDTSQQFFGKSSGLHVISPVLRQKLQSLGQDPTNPATIAKFFQRRKDNLDLMKNPWPSQAWSLDTYNVNPEYTFPDDDLIPKLLNAYFTHQNCFLPLLHKPTFDRAVAAQLHVYDHRFGAIVMMVCALGARDCIDDPRVFIDGKGAAGYKWFYQVALVDRNRNSPRLTTLTEMQTYALLLGYLQYIGAWTSTWAQTGLALHLAQEAGAHIRKTAKPTFQNELWKRAFWVIFFFEATAAVSTGRPGTLAYEEFDLDYPIECDDEYWSSSSDASLDFCQPHDKPSVISFFVVLLKLLQIQGCVKRVAYKSRPSLLSSIRNVPETEIVANLDTLLQQWKEDIPSHITWERAPQPLVPDKRISLFRDQRAFLLISYSYTRILLHRTYILDIMDASQLRKNPSSIICAEASYAALEAYVSARNTAVQENAQVLSGVNAASLGMLFLAFGNGPLPPDAMQKFDATLSVLKEVEKRTSPAGFLRDIMIDLAYGSGEGGKPSSLSSQHTNADAHLTTPTTAPQASASPKGLSFPDSTALYPHRSAEQAASQLASQAASTLAAQVALTLAPSASASNSYTSQPFSTSNPEFPANSTHTNSSYVWPENGTQSASDTGGYAANPFEFVGEASLGDSSGFPIWDETSESIERVANSCAYPREAFGGVRGGVVSGGGVAFDSGGESEDWTFSDPRRWTYRNPQDHASTDTYDDLFR